FIFIHLRTAYSAGPAYCQPNKVASTILAVAVSFVRIVIRVPILHISPNRPLCYNPLLPVQSALGCVYMLRITGSVGNNGQNRTNDVRTVQELLNKNIKHLYP